MAEDQAEPKEGFINPPASQANLVRVLILDDLGYPPETMNEERDLFSIAICKTLKGFDQIAEDSLRGNEHWALGPFDIFLSDMMLCNNPEHCKTPDHLATGLHTVGAGFLVAMMWAQRYPRAPQVIIPYSTRPDQFEMTWQLCTTLAPANLAIWRKPPLIKGRTSTFEIFCECAREFRENLVAGARRLDVMVVWDGKNRRGGPVKLLQPTIAGSETLEIRSFGSRRILRVASLFFDHLDLQTQTVPTDVVQSFLNDAQSTDSVDDIARVEAKLYLHVANSRASDDRYALMPSDGARQEFKRTFQHALAQRFGDDTDKVRRRIFLYLMVAAYRDSYVPERLVDSDLETGFRADESRDAVDGTLEEFMAPEIERLKASGHKAAAKILEKQLEAARALGNSVEDFVFTTASRVTPFKRRLYQTLDPLPSRRRNPTFDSSQPVGAALAQVGLDFEELRAGNPARLTDDERRCVQRYADEMVPSGFPIPSWMASLSHVQRPAQRPNEAREQG